MNPVNKALWYIESHFAREMSLEEIANIGGVSRYHMSRAFGAAMGPSRAHLRDPQNHEHHLEQVAARIGP